MNERRKGEWGLIPKRKPRFFKLGSDWYYETREGVTRGPFGVLPEAEMDAKEFVVAQMGDDEVNKFAP